MQADTCARQAEHVGGRQPHVNIITFKNLFLKYKTNVYLSRIYCQFLMWVVYVIVAVLSSVCQCLHRKSIATQSSHAVPWFIILHCFALVMFYCIVCMMYDTYFLFDCDSLQNVEQCVRKLALCLHKKSIVVGSSDTLLAVNITTKENLLLLNTLCSSDALLVCLL